MNIIYIHTHDSGRYMEPYGYKFDNPNLLKLAEDSILFRKAFNCGPTCSPSRAALLTGQAPHSCGMTGLAHRGFKLNDNNQHLANFLSSNGYNTALFGVQHESVNPYNLGYSLVSSAKLNTSTENDYQNAVDAAAYIMNKKDDKPFFMAFGMINTHREYPEIDDDIDTDYIMPPSQLPDTKETREDMARYASSLKVVDKCVGIVMNAIKNSGIVDDTVVIFTTDHGIAFPWMKCSLKDGGIGVALIIKYPKAASNNKISDALISHIDVFPTICDILDLEKPDYLQGVSILPILNGKCDKIRDEIFSEVTYHAAYEPKRCIRTERYKYIKFYDNHDRIVPANCDDGFSKRMLMEYDYINKQHDMELLFDLIYDPSENNNLAYKDEFSYVRADMQERLDEWMHKTDDAMLNAIDGRVEAPEGSRVNTRTTTQPYNDDWE